MVLRRGVGHWSRLLPSETFDKSCLAVLLKNCNPWCQNTLVSPCPDGGWLLPQVLSHPSCSCPSCLSLGEALSGRWVDLSFSLCGRSACVSLYFLGIVERSQAGHLGTGASGRQTPQAPGTSTTFSPFFQGSCRCANIAPPMVKPVKRRSLVQWHCQWYHVILVHDDYLQRVLHFKPVEWNSLEYTSTKYQFRNLTIRARVGSGGINSKRFDHFTWKQTVILENILCAENKLMILSCLTAATGKRRRWW